jgi:predicted SAM-dependent methyltransferase
MPTFLHVGCGPGGVPIPVQFHEWNELRMDIEPAVKPDVVGSITEIDMLDNSVEGVYASHILEHVEQWDVQTALSEVLRVLVPGGTAIIITPDLAAWAQWIVEHPGEIETVKANPAHVAITALDVLFGFQPDVQDGREYMRHRTAFTKQTLAAHLQSAGFAGAYVIAKNWQLCAIAQKGLTDDKKG